MITIKMSAWTKEDVHMAYEVFRIMRNDIQRHCLDGECEKCTHKYMCEDIEQATHFLSREIDLNYPHIKTKR